MAIDRWIVQTFGAAPKGPMVAEGLRRVDRKDVVQMGVGQKAVVRMLADRTDVNRMIADRWVAHWPTGLLGLIVSMDRTGVDRKGVGLDRMDFVVGRGRPMGADHASVDQTASAARGLADRKVIDAVRRAMRFVALRQAMTIDADHRRPMVAAARQTIAV